MACFLSSAAATPSAAPRAPLQRNLERLCQQFWGSINSSQVEKPGGNSMNIPLFNEWRRRGERCSLLVLHPNFLLNRRSFKSFFNAKTGAKFFGGKKQKYYLFLKVCPFLLSFFPFGKPHCLFPLGNKKDDIESTIFWQQFYDLDIKGRRLQALNSTEHYWKSRVFFCPDVDPYSLCFLQLLKV